MIKLSFIFTLREIIKLKSSKVMLSTKPIFSEKTVKVFRFKTMIKWRMHSQGNEMISPGLELRQSVGFRVKHVLIPHVYGLSH